jgi:N-acetylneuraminic acid mutarotase
VYHGGEFYVFGGETRSGGGATADRVYDRVDVYNPATNRWRLGPAMPTARHGIYPLLHAGRIYVAGGGTVAGFSRAAILEVLNVG